MHSPTPIKFGHWLHDSGAGYLLRRVPWAARLPGLAPPRSAVTAVLYLDAFAGLTCRLVQGRRIQNSARAQIVRGGS
ncbi:hypothetical protein LEL_10709 [Akanthomyces lecanii RCEF 1005]|uniref:Uncharacterized protein n=1 Tax=Akanthomyces lecanii RCEF 1005 TaxID=1081108 RepID=A0A167V9G9_CORDF|nr:hypothetical protein LEL_10709 [Akanthomyces lecanii RCEF 1005]